jgi:hypothetical protein
VAWRVLGGSTASTLRPVADRPKNGFETTIGLSTSLRYFAVQALGSRGRVLGTSAVVFAPG